LVTDHLEREITRAVVDDNDLGSEMLLLQVVLDRKQGVGDPCLLVVRRNHHRQIDTVFAHVFSTHQ
jgi:hypothetical protein